MGPVLEWAREWQALVTIIGTFLLVLYVRETYLIRLATITSAAPGIRLTIGSQRQLRVLNIEGRVAYNVLLDGFVGTVGGQRVRCTFTPIPHLPPGDSVDPQAQVESLIETAEGYVFYEGDTWLEVLRTATGTTIGLPLRMRYEDGTGMRYIVRITMPNRINLGLVRVSGYQPTCSPPRPLVTLARIEDRIVWPLVRAVKHSKIAQEVTRKGRRSRE